MEKARVRKRANTETGLLRGDDLVGYLENNSIKLGVVRKISNDYLEVRDCDTFCSKVKVNISQVITNTDGELLIINHELVKLKKRLGLVSAKEFPISLLYPSGVDIGDFAVGLVKTDSGFILDGGFISVNPDYTVKHGVLQYSNVRYNEKEFRVRLTHVLSY
jgi:hypothetical protein